MSDTPTRCWRLEVLADGTPFHWSGGAHNEQDAFRRAAAAMVAELPGVEPQRVQLVACIETIGEAQA